MHEKRTLGQTTLEFVVLIAVIIAAILAMQFYAKHAVEGRLKASSDQIGDQFDIVGGSFVVDVENKGKRKEVIDTNGVKTSQITTPETQTRKTSTYTIPKAPSGKSLFNE